VSTTHTPPVAVTTQTFLAEVIEVSDQIPVLVDFWAPWCGPCKQLEPVLHRLAGEFDGRLKIAKVNTDEEPELAGELGIRSLPTVVLFKDRAIADHFVGVIPEKQIRDILGKHLPEPEATPIERARAAKTQRDWAQARSILEAALVTAPKDIDIQAELGEVAALSGELDRARTMLEELQAREPSHRAVKRLEALLRFNDVVTAFPDPQALEDTLAADSNNLDAHHALAVHRLLSGQHEAALEDWLQLMRQHRSFRDDLARKSLVAAFELLGEADPLVGKTRREMARMLF
jgi:putative thioredoxin